MRLALFRLLQKYGRFVLSVLPVRTRRRLNAIVRELLVPNPMVVQGIKLWRHPVDADSDRTRMLLGIYEPETTELLLSLLQPGMRFVDVGAHIGYFAILASRVVGTTGRVWAFEPMPATVALLERNVKENLTEGIVEVVRMAVTDKAGHTLLFPHSLFGRSSVFERGGMRAQDAVRVETTSLDAWFERKHWPRVDVVKMDIEGAEAIAARGMPQLVRRNPHVKLIIEFNPVTLEAAKVAPEEFFAVLRDTGFDAFHVVGEAKGLSIPRDIQWLITRARDSQDNINILCGRS